MYNATTLKPVGQCVVQLTNPETQRKYRVKFTVIDNEHCTNLLGSSVAQQMGLVDVHYDIIGNKHTEEKIHAATHAPIKTQVGLTIPQIVCHRLCRRVLRDLGS